MDKKFHSSVLNERTYPNANIVSNHNMVAIDLKLAKEKKGVKDFH